MEQQKMQRISELTRIAKERALTDAETEERLALRQEYMAEMRLSLQTTLDNTYLVDEHGNKTKLERKSDK
ncbi:DUF896 domain-containing protein [Oscillospiraceae bacterium PP1C4]